MVEQFWAGVFEQLAKDWKLWVLWIPTALLMMAFVRWRERVKRRRESRGAAGRAAKPPVRRRTVGPR